MPKTLVLRELAPADRLYDLFTTLGRLAEAGVVGRERVDACCATFRGLIVISTLDFLFSDRPLGQDLAHRQVREILYGFVDGRAPDGPGRGQ